MIKIANALVRAGVFEFDLEGEAAGYAQVLDEMQATSHNGTELGDWEANVSEYVADLQAGLESLNAAPQTEEERQEIIELKKQIVNTLVKKITIDRNRELHVEISLNLLGLLDDKSNSNNSDGGLSRRGQMQLGGTYTHKRLSLFHPHHYASCG